MREVLSIWTCSHEGCPKISRGSGLCPDHKVVMVKEIYQRVHMPGSSKARTDPEPSGIETLVTVMESFAKIFGNRPR